MPFLHVANKIMGPGRCALCLIAALYYSTAEKFTWLSNLLSFVSLFSHAMIQLFYHRMTLLIARQLGIALWVLSNQHCSHICTDLVSNNENVLSNRICCNIVKEIMQTVTAASRKCSSEENLFHRNSLLWWGARQGKLWDQLELFYAALCSQLLLWAFNCSELLMLLLWTFNGYELSMLNYQLDNY